MVETLRMSNSGLIRCKTLVTGATIGGTRRCRSNHNRRLGHVVRQQRYIQHGNRPENIQPSFADIANDSDYLMNDIGREGEPQSTPNRVLAWPELVRHRLADYDSGPLVIEIITRKVAARN